MSKQHYIDQLLNTMGQLKKLLENQAHESHEERAATIMQFSALKFLKSTGNKTIGELAGYLRLSKSSATQLVERLVKAGFVTRVNDEIDRRVVRISITSIGEEHIGNLEKRYRDNMGKVFSKIPERDLQELIRIHTELIETLQKEKSN